MDANEYVNLLKERLTAAFDFRDPPDNAPSSCVVWAVHNRSSQKYFLSKSISLYTINNDEYVGLEIFPQGIIEEDLQSRLEQFKRLISKLQVDEKHMSTIFTSVLISEKEIDPIVIKKLEKVKIHKDFCFTLRGWADFAMVLIDLPNRKIYTNPFGKKMIKNFSFPC